MLLHDESLCFRTDNNDVHIAFVCPSCLSYLHRNKMPPLSLANGMWIGPVPGELKILTLPECILVARHFPAAYIVKLYPKKKGHSGLRGNISTYCLNTEDIAKMTDAQIMPPRTSILAATIGITFVGPRNVPEKMMPGFLHVNQNCVQMVLQWLKQNNPLYEHIIICPERLNTLPVDGFPQEILSVTRHLPDTDILAAENDGYVVRSRVCVSSKQRGFRVGVRQKLTIQERMIKSEQMWDEAERDETRQGEQEGC
ncbi:hypothetical protein EDB89DRAFT_1879858 [Lactarius sanguifluus]|nr:hypothetical protein EDB89DRAFT_1879858 [Lactarius sanguifluus]